MTYNMRPNTVPTIQLPGKICITVFREWIRGLMFYITTLHVYSLDKRPDVVYHNLRRAVYVLLVLCRVNHWPSPQRRRPGASATSRSEKEIMSELQPFILG